MNPVPQSRRNGTLYRHIQREGTCYFLQWAIKWSKCAKQDLPQRKCWGPWAVWQVPQEANGWQVSLEQLLNHVGCVLKINSLVRISNMDSLFLAQPFKHHAILASRMVQVWHPYLFSRMPMSSFPLLHKLSA